jgi:hypothetical protein
MLSLLLALFLGGQARGTAQPPTPTVNWEEEDRLDTRRGALVLEKGERDGTKRWRVRLKDKTLVEQELDELGLWELFKGDDGYDYVTVEHSTGGIACPYQFRVVEIGPKGETRVSEEFGSCLEPTKTLLYGNALVLEMPPYIPHPDLLSRQEIQRRQRTVEIFTVRRGQITTRSEVRR